MRFSPAILDEIRARLSVSQVVGRKVALKRKGREFGGLSPFKSEKSPSFFVNDQKGFYHCFASGEHGDIFKFLMTTEGLSFSEAVEQLAAEAGVPLPKATAQDAERESERTRLYALLEVSAAFFEAQLQGPNGAEARAYLDKRGVQAATVKKFRLGYGPKGRAALKEHLAKAGFTTEEMITSGMLIGGEDIPVAYDRFRDRVMFPITDLKDRPIAFGGRAMQKDERAKYLNSPETPLFHKGGILFNAAKARPLAFEREQVIAVEGYMDVVALTEGGFGQSVAPLGTALTEDQVKLLWRMTPEPILCFDGDAAGQKAAYRAVDTVLPHLKPGISVSFVFLPDGLDPDDMIRRQGAEAMKACLANAKPLSEVLYEREWAQSDWSTPERRARLEAQLRALVGKIADPSVRSHYGRAIAERLAKAWGHPLPAVPTFGPPVEIPVRPPAGATAGNVVPMARTNSGRPASGPPPSHDIPHDVAPHEFATYDLAPYDSHGRDFDPRDDDRYDYAALDHGPPDHGASNDHLPVVSGPTSRNVSRQAAPPPARAAGQQGGQGRQFSSGQSWSGNGGGKGARGQYGGGPNGGPNGVKGGGGKFQGKFSGKLPPWIKPTASDALRQSRMVGGGRQAVPHREALMLKALLQHPWLIDDHAEDIARLTFSLPTLMQLRDAVLACAATNSAGDGGNVLDSQSLRSQLERLSLGHVIDLVNQAITHACDRFARPDAEKVAVEAGWSHALALHERQLGLERELDAAEMDWHSDGSEAAFVRICEIKQMIASSNVTEPSTDI
jgi:DNA primase